MTLPSLQRASAAQWAALLLGLTALLRLPIFFYPLFNGDEATYAALANALLDGNLLYVGAVDHKPPLISATYALILGLFGRFSLDAVHAVSILVVACTGLLTGAALQLLGLERRAARWAGLSWVVFSSVGPGKDMLAANAELFMLLPSAGAIWLLLRAAALRSRVPQAALLLAAGAAAGLAFLYKYQGGAIFGTMTLLVLLDRRRPVSVRLTAVTTSSVGLLLPLLAVLGLYAAAGELSSLAFWAWTYPLQYAGKLPATDVLRNAVLMSAAWAGPALLLLLAAGAGFRSMWRRGSGHPERQVAVLGALWLLGALAGVVAGGRFFLHYYLQAVLPLAVLAGPTLSRLIHLQPASPRRVRRLRAVAVGLLVLPCTAYWVANALDHQLRPRIPRHMALYDEVGRWVQANSAPEEKIFVWGNSPELYHFSRRRMGTRFPFCNYHSGKIWGTPWDEEGARPGPSQQLAEAWPLLLQDLRQRRPTLVIDAAAGGLDRWRGHALTGYPRLWGPLSRDYREVGRVAGAVIYRRRERARDAHHMLESQPAEQASR